MSINTDSRLLDYMCFTGIITSTAKSYNSTLLNFFHTDNGFPVWAIAVISAVGVIVVVGGFVLATIIGRKLARSQEYSIG